MPTYWNPITGVRSYEIIFNTAIIAKIKGIDDEIAANPSRTDFSSVIAILPRGSAIRDALEGINRPIANLQRNLNKALTGRLSQLPVKTGPGARALSQPRSVRGGLISLNFDISRCGKYH